MKRVAVAALSVAAMIIMAFSLCVMFEGCTKGYTLFNGVTVARRLNAKCVVGVIQHRPNRFYYKVVLTRA